MQNFGAKQTYPAILSPLLLYAVSITTGIPSLYASSINLSMETLLYMLRNINKQIKDHHHPSS